jgi:hypothetical protein
MPILVSLEDTIPPSHDINWCSKIVFIIDKQAIHNSSVTLWTPSSKPPPKDEKLASSISKILIEEHGTGEFLKRLADPLWFQSFGCIIFPRYSD